MNLANSCSTRLQRTQCTCDNGTPATGSDCVDDISIGTRDFCVEPCDDSTHTADGGVCDFHGDTASMHDSSNVVFDTDGSKGGLAVDGDAAGGVDGECTVSNFAKNGFFPSITGNYFLFKIKDFNLKY